MAQNLQTYDENTSIQTTNLFRFGLKHTEFKYCVARYFIRTAITNILIRSLDLATKVSKIIYIYNITLSLVACMATYIYIDCP